jgi:hypothetical protein
MQKEIIQELAKIGGCRFISLVYRSKETHELSRYVIGIGGKLERVYKRDLKVLSLIQTHNELEETAKRELIDSLKDSLKLGIGNNPRYTCKGVYRNLFPGLKIQVETFDLHINGFLLSKKVIEAGEYKNVKSSAKTLKKNEYRRKMKTSRIRQFILPNIQTAKLNGKTLEIE